MPLFRTDRGQTKSHTRTLKMALLRLRLAIKSSSSVENKPLVTVYYTSG
jgi:hypothetical protein